MKSRYTFFDKITEDAYLGPHPGDLDYSYLRKYLISDNDTYYTIPLIHQYRPDLISYFFYNTTSLQWVLTYVNEINDSPEGYTINRLIRIPNKQKLLRVL